MISPGVKSQLPWLANGYGEIIDDFKLFSFPQSLKHYLEIKEAIIKRTTWDKDVINVDHGYRSGQTHKHLLHQPLKGGWDITEPEWRNFKFQRPFPVEKAVFSLVYSSSLTCL